MSASHKVLSYGDVVLRRQDVDLLLGPHWLNDQIIAFGFEHMARELHPGQTGLLLVPGAVAYLLRHVGPGDASAVLDSMRFGSAQLALFVVNDNPDVERPEGGSHWSLLAYWAPGRSFHHYDSYAGGNARAAQALASALAAAAGLPKPTPIEEPVPQQRNAYDCGVHVLAAARALCARYAAHASLPGSGMILRLDEGDVQGAAELRIELHDVIQHKS